MDFIAQAFKGKAQWYHYFGGTLLSFFIMQFGAIPLGIASSLVKNPNLNPTNLNPGLDNNLFLFLMIIPFGLGLWGLYISIIKIHRLPFIKALTSRPKIDWHRFLYAFLVWFLMLVAFLILDLFFYENNYVGNFKPIPFLILVLVSFLFMPLQTSFEELLFRGYLMQGFGVVTRSRLAALVVTSSIFGLLHFANPEVAKLGNILLIHYIATGFLFGIIALMDDGIELTLGLHAANNIAAAIFVTTNWSVFQTDALFVNISEPKIDWTTYATIIVIYPAVLFIFSKKYGWTNWRQKLMGKVEIPLEITEEITVE